MHTAPLIDYSICKTQLLYALKMKTKNYDSQCSGVEPNPQYLRYNFYLPNKLYH